MLHQGTGDAAEGAQQPRGLNVAQERERAVARVGGGVEIGPGAVCVVEGDVGGVQGAVARAHEYRGRLAAETLSVAAG
ncbi:hypothetical protein [Kitasatospora griseola]|uniref:hypothetical protein n=1 Tax=Kitasatospora griseola TaxID=2064 RepID=UPI0034423AE6